jgi:hypothetical protein
MRKIILIILVLSLSGCKLEDVFPVSAVLKNKVDAQQQTIVSLQNQITALKDQLNTLQANYNSRISKLETKVLSLWVDANYAQSTQLSVTERDYSVVKTNLGNLLFIVQDVSPYANGVKLKLRIGNLNSATFHGIKMDFSWGKNVGDSFNHHKTVDLTTDLLPGYWTEQDVILAPAKTDEMSYISVIATLNQVGLNSRRPTR